MPYSLVLVWSWNEVSAKHQTDFFQQAEYFYWMADSLSNWMFFRELSSRRCCWRTLYCWPRRARVKLAFFPLVNHNTINTGSFYGMMKLFRSEYCTMETLQRWAKVLTFTRLPETGHYVNCFHHQPNVQNIWAATKWRDHKKLCGDPKDVRLISGFWKRLSKVEELDH